MTRSHLLCAVLFLSLAACRGSSQGDDDGDDVDGANLDDASIYDIQGDLAVGTEVNIRGVVVVAIDNYGVNKGNVYVMEPEGGPYSGTFLYGAPLSQVADLEVGDLVDIEHAVKTEFALSDDTSGRTTTEMVAPDGGEMSIVKVGDGEVPAPEVVDALAIGTMADVADQDAEWEKWEGVLIKVENVSINDGLRTIGSSDPLFVSFSVTGPLNVEATMAPPIDPVTEGDCLASVTGIADYFYDWLLLPAATADIVTGGSGCPSAEAQDNTCDNGLDDDADGFLDCGDFSCDVVAACTTDTSVMAVQQGNVADGENIHLTGVFITGIDNVGSTQGFWVADNLQAAAYDGVFVFTGDTITPGAAIGATADITGEVDEFDYPFDNPMGDKLTEVVALDESAVTITAGANAPLPLTGIAPNTLKEVNDTTNSGEPYEGVLVQLSNVKVTVNTMGTADRITVRDNNNQTIVVDDDAYDYDDANYPMTTTCFQTLTGIMSINITDNERRLMPRSADDMDTTGGACN